MCYLLAIQNLYFQNYSTQYCNNTKVSFQPVLHRLSSFLKQVLMQDPGWPAPVWVAYILTRIPDIYLTLSNSALYFFLTILPHKTTNQSAFILRFLPNLPWPWDSTRVTSRTLHSLPGSCIQSVARLYVWSLSHNEFNTISQSKW